MTATQFLKHCPATSFLLITIIAVFVIMAMMGVSIESPDSRDLVRFGANFLPLTLHEPYRLITSGFIHIGIMHLLFNGFALYFFGQVAEQAFGRLSLICLFVLSVVGGNLLNLAYTLYQFAQTGALNIAAGASGGIMGLGAALTVLSFSRHPLASVLNKKNLLLVMGANLMLGFVIPGIDNAGHLGGAMTGLILGIYLANKTKAYWDYVIYGAMAAVFVGIFIAFKGSL